MPVSPSPITRVLAWLTVSVCILAGAPLPRHSVGPRTGLQRTEVSEALAKGFAALDREPVRSPSANSFVKIWEILGAPSKPLTALPEFALLWKIEAPRGAPLLAARARWVGEIELRI